MGRRRRRVEAELIELVRSELNAIRTEVQTTLADSAAILSSRVRIEIEQRMGEPHALAAGIQNVRETLATRDSELTHVLTRVVETCETLAECVQLDHGDRTALIDAVSRLTTVLTVAGSYNFTTAPDPGRQSVIGGTVDPAMPLPSAIDSGPHDEIDLEAEAREPEPEPERATTEVPAAPPRPGRPVRPDGVEVRCRFGDRWVTGFEVCEVIRLDDVTRYRLRRRSDGSVIPTLFDEKDLRFFSTQFVDPTATR